MSLPMLLLILTGSGLRQLAMNSMYYRKVFSKPLKVRYQIPIQLIRMK